MRSQREHLIICYSIFLKQSAYRSRFQRSEKSNRDVIQTNSEVNLEKMTLKETLREHEFSFFFFFRQFSSNKHQQKTVYSAVQCAQVQERSDDVVFTKFSNQKVQHHCHSRIVNQRIYEHHSSFFERQSFFILFESDRDEEESCSCMHFRH
jgi:hypothetical protein